MLLDLCHSTEYLLSWKLVNKYYTCHITGGNWEPITGRFPDGKTGSKFQAVNGDKSTGKTLI